MNENSSVVLVDDGHDLFIIVDGRKIAKRGHWGTPHAKTWITLAPGWLVESDDAVLRISPPVETIH